MIVRHPPLQCTRQSKLCQLTCYMHIRVSWSTHKMPLWCSKLSLVSGKTILRGGPLFSKIPTCNRGGQHKKDGETKKNTGRCKPSAKILKERGVAGVGDKLKIWWPMHQKYCKGTIYAWIGDRGDRGEILDGEHTIVYDDDDVETVVLKE